MKNCIFIFLIVFTTAYRASAEELSNYTNEQIGETISQNRQTIAACVRSAAVAGVGVFLRQPSPQEPFVDIDVQEWWTPALTNSIIRVHYLNAYSPSNWIFPTNTPVVFFAITKRQADAKPSAYTNPGAYSPEYCYSVTNETEASKFIFGDMDRSWFRIGRDDGRLYSFATNLWDCIRVNPNPTNYYKVLRDADRTVSYEDSWRVNLDASRELSWIYALESEDRLAEILNDPLLSPPERNHLGNVMNWRFNWKYIYTNGVETWTPPER